MFDIHFQGSAYKPCFLAIHIPKFDTALLNTQNTSHPEK